MIIVIATLTTKPGALDALRGPAAECMAATRREKGCISYDLNASLSDPETLVFIERWESRDALSGHFTQPHMKVWREASGPHLVSRKVEIIHPDQIEIL